MSIKKKKVITNYHISCPPESDITTIEKFGTLVFLVLTPVNKIT